MSDRRYSTSAWQRTRKAILQRDGGICRVQGPRCTGRATTVHHIIPSSQRPDLFYASDNLVSACGACNYGEGSRIASDNKRATIEQLYEIIAEREQQIEVLLERLAQYEKPPAPAIAKHPAKPAIY